jgi:hypothetical protein
VIVIFLIVSCGKDSVEPKAPVGEAEELGLEFTNGVVTVGSTESPDPVLSIDSTTNTYVFSEQSFTAAPKRGQIILIPGKHMRKVVSAKKSGNNYAVVTEDAALTEVIKNGTIEYTLQPEWSDEASLLVDGKSVRLNSAKSGPLEFVFSSGGIEHKVTIEPKLKDGKISSCNFKIQMAQKVNGRPSISFIGEGEMTLPPQQTKIEIKDGKLADFKNDNRGMSGKITLSISAADGSSGSHGLVMPGLALSFPIRYLPTPFGTVVPNPIPMSIDIGVQFVSQITFSGTNSSATGKSTITYDADAGFSYKGGNVETYGKANKDNIEGGAFDSASFIGNNVDVQFGVAFPRVGLKVAGQELAYTHVGFTTGSKIQWGPLCKSGYAKMVIEGGYALQVLGSTLFSEKKTFYEKSKEAKGEGCQ